MDDKRALADAEAEVRRLMIERARIDHRLTGLYRIIEALKFLKEPESASASEKPYAENYGGFTGFIKMLFGTTRVPLTATDVRDFVRASGIEGSDSENVLNHVHGVITRLRKQQTIEEVPGNNNKPAYIWSSHSREMTPTPDAAERFRTQFNVGSFETRVAAVPPVYRDVLRQSQTTDDDSGAQRSISRAIPPKGSLAEQSFAIEDAKKRSIRR